MNQERRHLTDKDKEETKLRTADKELILAKLENIL